MNSNNSIPTTGATYVDRSEELPSNSLRTSQNFDFRAVWNMDAISTIRSFLKTRLCKPQLTTDLFVLAFLFLLPLQTTFYLKDAYAEQNKEDISISEETLKSFIEVAISNYLPVIQTFPELTSLPPLERVSEADGCEDANCLIVPVVKKEDSFLYPTEFKRRYPWLYEFVYRENGVPKTMVINKWTKPFKISVNYPLDLQSFADVKDNNPINEPGSYLVNSGVRSTHKVKWYVSPEQESKTKQAEEIIISEIQKTIPSLKKGTGLEISYIPHSSETKNDFAQIRVVLVNYQDDWGTQFKQFPEKPFVVTGSKLANNYPIEFRSELENYNLPSAVHFTPYSGRQVDGYFLSDKNNEIQMAFCFIWQGHTPEILKALTQECLIRSLGLPDAPRNEVGSLLSLWNDNEKFKKHELQPTPTQMSNFDFQMLRLLYDAKLKPGMGAYEAYKAINSH